MSATVDMALWLERNFDPTAPVEQSVEEFCRAFPHATRKQFKAALELLVRATTDRIAAEEADLAAARAVLRQLRGEG